MAQRTVNADHGGTVMTKKSVILSVVALCALPAAGQAQVLLNENFNELTPGPFTTTSTAVGTQFTASQFQLRAGCPSPASGNCIMLQNALGSLTSIPVTLDAGKAYFLSFDIVGNSIAGGTSVTKVTLGSVFNQTFTLNNSPTVQSDMVNEVLRPTSNITTDLIFQGVGVNRTNGMLIDNISLAVPEPATLGLMVLGLFGAGFAGRKRSN
jgi:hypothetical protein